MSDLIEHDCKDKHMDEFCSICVGRMEKEIERLRAALEDIAESKFCAYENTGSGQYGIGVTDGHRFCAKLAKAALKENDK